MKYSKNYNTKPNILKNKHICLPIQNYLVHILRQYQINAELRKYVQTQAGNTKFTKSP